jgi:two-component system response regulator HydG
VGRQVWQKIKMNRKKINMKEIIVIEDNDTMRLGIVESLRREGFLVKDFSDGETALAYIQQHPVLLVVSDLKMTPLDGVEVLKRVKEQSSKTEVLLISAYGTVEIAVEAMQMGAADFLTKPFSSEELRIRIRKIIDRIEERETIDRLKERNLVLSNEIREKYGEIIGISKKLQEIFGLVEKIAGEDSTVLIEGESGTGKELIAHAIHQKSKRADMPFIRVNCGALNENLLESELFGHEKGSFTGAIKQKKGRFELANGGTLFLDEIGDVSSSMQIKLLRAIQEKEFERVGGEQTLKTDIRIISATNQNLKQLISENCFREDLFYRLSVIPIKLPALRERKEDIPLLTEHFIEKFTTAKGQPVKKISEEGMGLLINYSWPGNIRELENLVERLIVICSSVEIDSQLIAQHLGNVTIRPSAYPSLPLEEAVNAFEKNLIEHALRKTGGIKNQAAKMLGINTSSLYYKLEKFGLLK